ncbi:MAG: hypothetical protein AB1757_14260 [Acidobacteriota bacterium]
MHFYRNPLQVGYKALKAICITKCFYGFDNEFYDWRWGWVMGMHLRRQRVGVIRGCVCADDARQKFPKPECSSLVHDTFRISPVYRHFFNIECANVLISGLGDLY